MKTLLALLFQLFNFVLYAQDFSLYQKREFKNGDGRVLPYRILFPENYDRTKKYPLVLFLHGAGERGDDNVRQLFHVAGTFLKKEVRASFPCIVIAPQCPAKDFWSSVTIDTASAARTFVFSYKNPIQSSLGLAIALTQQVISEEAVDRHRVYIAGLSMGGMGTFEAVYRYPTLFAAAVAVCGGADLNAFDFPFVCGPPLRFRLLKHINRIRKTSFWVFHGEKDEVVDVRFSREVAARLHDLHAEVTYTEYPGVGHNSWDKAFAEPELLPWMFARKR